MTFTLPYIKHCLSKYLCPHLLLCCGLFFSHATLAHNIPASLTLHAYIKPQAQQLHLLIRVPMEAFNEIDFPANGPGFLDFTRLDSVLKDVARSYVTESVHIYENGQELTSAQLRDVRVTLPTDKSFVSFQSAVDHFSAARLDNSVELYRNQGMLDAWFVYPIQSEQSKFHPFP